MKTFKQLREGFADDLLAYSEEVNKQAQDDEYRRRVVKYLKKKYQKEDAVTEANKHSVIGRIQRGNELKSKVDSSFKDIGDAQRAGDSAAGSKAFRKHERYANLERPGTWTKSVEEGIADTIKKGVKKGVKNVKRGMQGWGVGASPEMIAPSGVVSGIKNADDKTINNLIKGQAHQNKGKKPKAHSPQELGQRVLGREISKRGLHEDGMAGGAVATGPTNTTSSGAVAGMGQPPGSKSGEPGVDLRKKKKNDPRMFKEFRRKAPK